MRRIVFPLLLIAITSCASMMHEKDAIYPVGIDRELRISESDIREALDRITSYQREGRIYEGYNRSCFKEDELAKKGAPVLNYVEVPTDLILILRYVRYVKSQNFTTDAIHRAHNELKKANLQKSSTDKLSLMIESMSCWMKDEKGKERFVLSEREYIPERDVI